MGMIKSGLGATVAVVILSVAVSGILHFALSQHRTEANAAVSGEITSSIPR
jgi:chemotaxis receptor (MCP) glutamine deamidase CheD